MCSLLQIIRKRENRIWGRDTKGEAERKVRIYVVKYNLLRNNGGCRIVLQYLVIALLSL